MSPGRIFDRQFAAQLARDLASASSPDEGLRIIARHAQELPGCDHAGTTILSQGRLFTQGATHPMVLEVDAAQYAAASGPCVDSAVRHELTRTDDLLSDVRWPEFTRAAVGVGICSTMSFPLGTVDNTLGSLNCYSGKTAAFGQIDEELGGLLAGQASLLLLGTVQLWQAREEIDQLHQAVESRQVIGQAVGILMVRNELHAGAAFEHLREVSQRQNRKLRDVAREITSTVGTSTERAGPPSLPM